MAGTGIGGFILMGANIPPTEGELRALTAGADPDPALPPLIAIDQEGGDVSRLPWDGFPSALTLKDLPPDASRDAFAGRSALVVRAGIGVNFGIVADVTADPSSFIYRRALGTTPAAGRRARRRGRRRREGRRALDAQALPRARCRRGGLACRHPVDRRCRRRHGSRRMPCRSDPGSTPARRS